MVFSAIIVQLKTQEVLEEHIYEGRDRLLGDKQRFIQLYLEAYERKIRVINNLPPIQGLIRTRQAEIDPVNQSTRAQWMRRLNDIFHSEINEDHQIYQLRFINHLGQEIVRVDRRGNQVLVVDEDQLQDKSHRDYFLETSRLKADEVFISDIDLNQERGKIEVPHVPVFRIAAPVFDEGTRDFAGIVIMNIYAHHMMTNIWGESRRHFILLNEKGNYLYDSRHPELAFSGQSFFEEQPELRLNTQRLNKKWHRDREDGEVRIWRKFAYDRGEGGRYWILLERINEEELLSPMYQVRDAVLIAGGIGILLVLLLGGLTSRSLARPILALNRAAKDVQPGDKQLDIDPAVLDSKDEIGELAQSIRKMTAALVSLNTELEDKVIARTKELHTANQRMVAEMQSRSLAEARFRKLFQAAPSAMIIFDQDLKISMTNPSAQALFAYKEGEMKGRYISEFLTEEKFRQQQSEKLGLSPKGDRGEVRTFQLDGTRKDGKPFNAAVRLSSVQLADGETYSLMALVDITDSMKYQREISEKNRDLETLLYVVTHDLKEPLRAVENFSQVVLDDYSKHLDDRGQDLLNRVVRAAGRMRMLLDDLLKLSRTRTVALAQEPVAIDTVVHSALDRLEEPIKKSQAKIQIGELSGDIVIQRTWAEEAIYNLVGNCIKYAKPDEPPTIEIESLAEPDLEHPGEVGLVIRDRGIGIKADQAELIFELFKRAVGREIEGTGAGLAIVRAIAQKSGGRTWARPREGGGSEFYLVFGKPEKDDA